MYILEIKVLADKKVHDTTLCLVISWPAGVSILLQLLYGQTADIPIGSPTLGLQANEPCIDSIMAPYIRGHLMVLLRHSLNPTADYFDMQATIYRPRHMTF